MSTRRAGVIGFFSCWGFLSCQSTPLVEVEQPAEESAEEVEEAQAIEHPDPGPTLHRIAGTREYLTHDEMGLTIDTWAGDGDHIYLRAELPQEVIAGCDEFEWVH